MKKIAFVIPSLFGGGAERAASIIANELGKDFYVCLITLEEGKSYELIEKIKYIQLTKLYCKANKLIKLLYFPIQLFKLKNILNKIVPDIIISFTERPSFMLHLLKQKKNIYSFHNYMSFHLYSEKLLFPIKILRNYFYKKFLKDLYKTSAYTVIMSKEAMLDLKNHFNVRSKIEVFYYPFEIKKIKNMCDEKSIYDFLFEKGKVLINIGRLEKQKGQWHLLRIFSELRKNRDTKLVILGDGSLRNYLLNLSRSLNLKTYSIWSDEKLNLEYDVYFLGFQKNPFRLIKLSTMFVLASLWEGFPNILVEALACLKTVITTDCHSGPRELLAPGSNPLQKTEGAEFSEYGILMPNLTTGFVNFNTPLSDVEKLWIKTLEGTVNNNIILEKYEKLAFNRALDFNVDKIMPQWHALIDKV